MVAMDLAPDALLGPYRLIEKIGAGGMGEVWKGEDTRLGRIVAIKILPQALADDPESRARLQREARTAAHLYHPNIATIHSIEEADDRLFIVMQYVDGEPLNRILKRGPLPEAEICGIGKGVADALAEAHAQGIVHRDIKPDNVIVSGGRVKVLDFGIAKQVGPRPSSGSNDPTAFMTQQGIIIGTVFYMSPEQALGRPLDQRTDIFSLGVVLYEAATGKLPFSGESVTETITKIVRDEPIPPMQVLPTVSPGLSRIIQRCLQKKREDRFETAEQLSAALDAQLGKAATERSVISPSPKTAKEDVSSNPTAITSTPGAAAAPVMLPRRPTPRPATPKARSSRAPLIIAIAAVAIIAVALGGIALFRGRASQSAPMKAPAPAQSTALAPSSSIDVSATTAPAAPPAIVEASTAARTESTVAPGTGAANRAPTDSNPTAAAQTSSSAAVKNPASTDSDADSGEMNAKSADGLYAEAISHLRNGEVGQSRKLLQRVIKKDPQYAPAHLRLGEIMLMSRNFDGAAQEYARAGENEARLNGRERAFLRLGSAVSMHDAHTARLVAQNIEEHFPGDPELAALQREFPGMLKESAITPGRPMQRRRPRP